MIREGIITRAFNKLICLQSWNAMAVRGTKIWVTPPNVSTIALTRGRSLLGTCSEPETNHSIDGTCFQTIDLLQKV